MKLTTSKTFEFSHASILFFKKTFDLVYVYNQQCWDLCSYFALLFSHIALNCFHIALNCSLIALHCSLVYVHWNYKKTGKTSRVRKKSRLNLRFVYKNMEYIFSSLANQIADIFTANDNTNYLYRWRIGKDVTFVWMQLSYHIMKVILK